MSRQQIQAAHSAAIAAIYERMNIASANALKQWDIAEKELGEIARSSPAYPTETQAQQDARELRRKRNPNWWEV